MRNHITLCIDNALKFQQTMSKSIYSLIAIIALCILTHSNSQAQSYKMGDNLLNVGIGVGVYSYGGLPIGASFEHGFTEQISAGGFIDYLSWKNSYSSYNYSWRFIYFGARGSYHLNELLNLNDDKFQTALLDACGTGVPRYDFLKNNSIYVKMINVNRLKSMIYKI